MKSMAANRRLRDFQRTLFFSSKIHFRLVAFIQISFSTVASCRAVRVSAGFPSVGLLGDEAESVHEILVTVRIRRSD